MYKGSSKKYLRTVNRDRISKIPDFAFHCSEGLFIKSTSDTSAGFLIVKCWFAFHCFRLQATRNLLPSVDVMTPCCEIVIKIAKARCEHYCIALQQYFSDCLTDARHVIATMKGTGGKAFST